MANWFGSGKAKTKAKDPLFDMVGGKLDYGYDRNLALYKKGAYRVDPWGGDWVANATPQTEQSWAMTGKLARNPWEGTANTGDYLNDVITGKYLDRDAPGLDSVLRKATNAANANYSMGGRYGSGAHDTAITEGVGGILYDNYARERAMQQGAAQFAPQYNASRYYDAQQLGQVGSERQAQAQAETDAKRAQWDANQVKQFEALKRYMSMFPQNFSAGSQTSSGPGMDWGQLLAGAGLGFLGL